MTVIPITVAPAAGAQTEAAGPEIGPATGPATSPEAGEGRELHHTTCYMCACRCGIQVTLEQGRVRFIQGTREHPVNQGVLCAKGSAGIMKQYSRAKLRQPLMRKPGSERGKGEFVPVSWDDALKLLTERLRAIRASDPKRLAFFTGRDQMQALTGLWAQQFGTPNWAAHGGFCSVNMAAAGLYSIGYSFWEFGAPDWDHARYFVLWGVAEDHSSNPIKIGLDKLKQRGAKFVSINPVRTGYSAIADEWVPVRPGSDGLLALSMVHVLLTRGLIDSEFLARYTNSPWLVVQSPGVAGDGLFVRDAEGHPLVWDEREQRLVNGGLPEITPALFGTRLLADGRRVSSVLQLAFDRYTEARYSPTAVAEETGVPAEVIERLALEMAAAAFEQTIELPIRWTDVYGRSHDKVVGRPLAMYAMRGISAHSNGFQSCRALHLIQMLLGALEGPGNFRAKAPFPKPVPPPQLPENNPQVIDAANTPLTRTPLGFPQRPEDLAIDAEGRPLRIDKAYSWEAPLAAHGAMHRVITNAANADPYSIDTLILFMANMAWNSSMDTLAVREALQRKQSGKDNQRGEDYAIPFLVVVDAFHSETVAYADLVLPDTTYLERYDAISLLDRPISEPDTVADSMRHPILKPDRDVRAWQEVLVDLAGRLGFPAFTQADGSPRYRDYPDFIQRYERAPGIGFLAGWRGEQGEKSLVGAPNPQQWQRYIDNKAFFVHHWRDSQKYLRMVNRDYQEEAVSAGFIPKVDPIIMQIYSEPLQRFRLAGQGLYPGPQPTTQAQRDRLVKYFDPLPDWHPPLEDVPVEHVSGGDAQSSAAQSPTKEPAQQYPLHAITQRPMMMYHAWDSQNVWLRQLLGRNFLYMNAATAEGLGLVDMDWVWVESRRGRIRCQMKTMQGCESGTVWTWNAIGKQAGAWGLDDNAAEAHSGFLLNHLIAEHLAGPPGQRPEDALGNADPITGQAAWFDLRVRVVKAAPGETGVWPVPDALPDLPGMGEPAPTVLGNWLRTPASSNNKDGAGQS